MNIANANAINTTSEEIALIARSCNVTISDVMIDILALSVIYSAK